MSKFVATDSVLAVSTDVTYAWWHERHREKKISAAFQSKPIPAPPHFIERPAVSAVLLEAFTSSPGEYNSITGNHGAGKSTIVKMVASETPGVLYVNCINRAGNIDATLAQALIDLLNREAPHALWVSVLLGKIFTSTPQTLCWSYIFCVW